jgi:RNA polymerase sigma-70 factor (ECF subfamily)
MTELDGSDVTLFKEVLKGNRGAADTFAKKYMQKVFNYCYMQLRHFAKAEDNTQETLLKFFKKMHTLRSPEKFKSYLFQIAKNCCIDQLRKNGREALMPSNPDPDNDGSPSIQSYLPPNTETPDKKLEKKQLSAMVDEKLGALNTLQREAIYLVHFEGLSYKDAGEILACPVGTLKSSICRGIIKLGQLLKKDGIIL